MPSNSNKKSRKKTKKDPEVQKSTHEKYLKMITTLEPVHVPVLKANGGFQYLYEADCIAKKDGRKIIKSNIKCNFKILIFLSNFFFSDWRAGM